MKISKCRYFENRQEIGYGNDWKSGLESEYSGLKEVLILQRVSELVRWNDDGGGCCCCCCLPPAHPASRGLQRWWWWWWCPRHCHPLLLLVCCWAPMIHLVSRGLQWRWRCGRGSRHTRQLPHSKQFPDWPSTWAHIISEGLRFCFIYFSSFILFLFSNFTFLFHLFKQQLSNLNIQHYVFPFPMAGQLGHNGPKHWTVGMRGNVRKSSAPVGAPGCMM